MSADLSTPAIQRITRKRLRHNLQAVERMGESSITIGTGELRLMLNLLDAAPHPAQSQPTDQGEPQTQTADHIAALAVTSEEIDKELSLSEVLAAGFKSFGYVHPDEAAHEACETIAAGPLPPRAVEADVLHRIYSQFIVNRGDLSDGEALKAIRQVCEQAGQGSDNGPT